MGSPEQHFPLVNLRELGGVRVAGGEIVSDRLWRSDDAARVTAAGAGEIVHRGISTILDLRSSRELARTGRGYLARYPLRFHHLPLLNVDVSPLKLRRMVEVDGDTPEVVGRWYAEIAVERAHVLVSGLQILGHAPGPVLFHCSAGKDRTGILAASVLSVLGAEPDAIAREYALTQPAMDTIIGRVTTGRPSWIPRADLEPSSAALGAPAETMIHFLGQLRRSHGGLDAMLRAAGLDEATRGLLQRQFVVDRSDSLGMDPAKTR